MPTNVAHILRPASRLLRAALPALLCIPSFACRDGMSSGTGPTPPPKSTSSSATEGGKRPARAGSAAGGQRAAIPRPPATPAEPGITCSGKPCASPNDAIYPCCLSDGTCGAGINGECRALEQPGEASDACAGHRANGAELDLRGCCKPDGRCGVLVEYGLGCVERSDLPIYLDGPLKRAACGPSAEDAGN